MSPSTCSESSEHQQSPPLDYYDEIDFAPSEQRQDEDLSPEALQLERRGVTSQAEFWRTQTYWKETILAKLDAAGASHLADMIRDCHTQRSVAVCCGCSKRRTFYNRCEVKWCPECQPRLSYERKRSVEWWTSRIEQPKHIVLTARNSDALTRETVTRFKKAFSRLRRSALARSWRGGLYSLEVTNEGRGWHLHLHALVDVRYVDARELARMWARCIGQDFAIVKVRDARKHQYLAEVTKYLVKGSQLASWTGQEIATFITAFNNTRTFGVFGTLYSERAEHRAFLDSIQEAKSKCECGCENVRIMTETEELMASLQPDTEQPTARSETIPPPELIPFNTNAYSRGL